MADGQITNLVFTDGYESVDEFEGVLTTYTPPLNTSSHIQWIVMGQEHGTGSFHLMWHGHEVVRRGSSGNPTLAATAPHFYEPVSAINPIRSATPTNFSMDIDVLGTDFRILVTGDVGDTVQWKSWLKIFQLEQTSTD